MRLAFSIRQPGERKDERRKKVGVDLGLNRRRRRPSIILQNSD